MGKPIAYKPHELDATRARKTGMQNRRTARNVAAERETQPIAVYSRPGRKITRPQAVHSWDTANATEFRRLNEMPTPNFVPAVKLDASQVRDLRQTGQSLAEVIATYARGGVGQVRHSAGRAFGGRARELEGQVALTKFTKKPKKKPSTIRAATRRPLL